MWSFSSRPFCFFVTFCRQWSLSDLVVISEKSSRSEVKTRMLRLKISFFFFFSTCDDVSRFLWRPAIMKCDILLDVQLPNLRPHWQLCEHAKNISEQAPPWLVTGGFDDDVQGDGLFWWTCIAKLRHLMVIKWCGVTDCILQMGRVVATSPICFVKSRSGAQRSVSWSAAPSWG